MMTQQSSQERPSELIDLGLSSIFDYDELKEATNFFNPSEEVGVGSFGSVYRGKLKDGCAVAIKEITVRHKKRREQFFNDVQLLSRLRHRNLVTLYGCTNPDDKMMLFVYEFVSNGTMADHLHHRWFSKKTHTWSQRLQIAIQTAEGLTYLHSLQPPVIDSDVKSNNILLDQFFNAKVADFGTRRLLPPSGSHVSTMPQGTLGYMDPEYNYRHKLTTKSDVYGFGVVLMELISGRAVLDVEREDGEIRLVPMALKKMKNDQLDQLVDSELGYLEDPKIVSTVNSVAELAYNCLQPEGHLRPPMVEVLKSLKQISDPSTSSGGDEEPSTSSGGHEEPTDLGRSSIFDYEELKEATIFFNLSKVIGKGGFGVVYQGKLRDGRAVAIKELTVRDKNLVEQCLNEIKLVSGLRHKNLATFYGYTNPEDGKMLLVYEFVPNGTVADHLHHRRFSEKGFTWSQRLQISIETAEGLAYLHSLQPPIVHCDVKTDNILLDNSFHVKIADFGLSRPLPSLGTHISTMPQGTQGYLDPEFNQLYKLTTMSDVYSFGVVLMELISSKAVLDYTGRDGDEIWLSRMALNKMKNNQLDQLVDLELGYQKDTKIFSTVTSVAQLACECLQPKRYMRPPMQEVLKSLKKIRDDAASTSSGGDDEIRLVNTASQEESSKPSDLNLRSTFGYDELQEAIISFNPSEVLGEECFGLAYRGKLRDGRAVTIKELNARHNKCVEQFFNELKLFSGIRHKNLVSLYGCTNPEVGKMLLVYEFVPNETLADHLHHRRFSERGFTWSQRLQIAIEAAEGLAYLSSFQPPVIHCDVNTSNILLNDKFNVKVAGLGMSRLLPSSRAYISPVPHGTQAYMEPEYKLTTKSDVYSFGVVLIELISGKSVLDYERDDDEIWLVHMALKKIKNEQLDQLVDPELGHLEDPKISSMANSVAELAYQCLQPTECMRPPMVEVLKSLKEIRDDDASTSSDDEIWPVNVASQEGPSEPTDLGGSSIFNYDELQEATQFFNPSEVVGEGGFGVVYRGKLRDGRAVAIKKLTVSHKKRVEPFLNEVWLLSRLCHNNLVRLYGATNPEVGKMLLVYEFVPNGTLADHLHYRRFSKKALTWSQRLQIAVEMAEGLAYMHSFQPPVIHCDIKTSNILLDDNFSVKIGDFGMSCVLPPSGAYISTVPKGTQGYLDPEYDQHYKLTPKSDVYSFGVVLIELISGKAVLDVKRDDDEIWLVRMAFNKIEKDHLEELVDPELGYLEDPTILSEVNSMVQLAYECLQPIGHTRPRMVEVLKSLKMISHHARPVRTQTFWARARARALRLFCFLL